MGSVLFDSAAQPHETQQDATVWTKIYILFAASRWNSNFSRYIKNES